MTLLIDFAVLVIGFFVLIKGADILIDGASSIGKSFNIPNVVIGLTVVAFGTSLPEMVVNIYSAIQGSYDLAIGNIVGSNISNILLILGVTAVMSPLNLGHGTVWKEIPLNILAVVLLGVMVNDCMLDGKIFNQLSRIDGVVLISFFIIFLYYVFAASKVKGKDTEEIDEYPLYKSIIFVVLGVSGLTLGGRWIVDSAISISSILGLSQGFIGLSIVALGTSLPELATSVVAALKKNSDLAVGNIVGSNIFNIFWVLGITSIINPINYEPSYNIDILILVLATVLFWVFMHTKNRYRLERYEGIIFLVCYVSYMGFLIWRG